jgi:hypothetical protein
MIDRFGQKINVGWAAHEDLWLEAANTLDRRERLQALHDIAALTGRAHTSVLARAARMRENDRRQAEAAMRKQIIRLPAEWSLGPLIIAPPSKARLMGTRA